MTWKGSVVGLTLPIVREFARFGIRVITISSGIFDAPMLCALQDAAQKSLSVSALYPKRLGSPDEYAALAHHIIENPLLNGGVVRFDGAIWTAPN